MAFEIPPAVTSAAAVRAGEALRYCMLSEGDMPESMDSREAAKLWERGTACVVVAAYFGNEWEDIDLTRFGQQILEVPLVEALTEHLMSIGAIAGQVDAVRAIAGPGAGFELAAIVEGGVPEVTHPLEQKILSLGGDATNVYWRSYCAGYQGMVLLREDLARRRIDRDASISPEHAQDPVEWMEARVRAAGAQEVARESRVG